MGCLESKPGRPRTDSDAIEIRDGASTASATSSPSNHESSKLLSPKEMLSAKSSRSSLDVNMSERSHSPIPQQETSSPMQEKSTKHMPPPSPLKTDPPPPPVAHSDTSARAFGQATPEKKLKMSEILHAERVKKTPSSVSSAGFTGEGREGWLYRENDSFGEVNDEAAESFLKVWVVVARNRLLYYSQRPKGDYLNNFTASGYLDLNSASSDCKVMDRKHDGGLLSSVGKFCFRVRDGGTTLIFSASSDAERNEWVFLIQEAIRGVVHTLNTQGSSSAAATDIRIPSKTRRVLACDSVELPKKTGMLKKKSIEGKKFGFKNVKSRWFRLEGGELRYYGEKSMRPSSLKKTISLKGCTMPTENKENDGDNITVTLPDGNSLLMIANSADSAREWRTAISDTIMILNKTLEGESKEAKKRRVNLSNVQYDDSPVVRREVVHKSEATVRSITSALQQHFLLCTLQEFEPVLDALQLSIYLPGDVIIWQDSVGDLFYILESGQVDIIKDNEKVARLGSGQAFGELALINDVNRTASVRAVTVCHTWSLDRKTLRHVLSSQQHTVKQNKIEFLETVTIFEKLNNATLAMIADVMTVASFSPGEQIIRQGEVGEYMYVIQSGTVVVTQSSFGGSVKELVRLSSGKYFGELALISNEPRKANVTAVDTVQCYVIDKATFTSVLGDLKEAEVESVGIAILKRVKLLQGLSEKQLATVSKNLTTVEFADGETIIQQGEEGDKFYMISSGIVSVYVNHAEVAKLQPGSYFGEMALMNDDRRNATVTAVGPVICLTLDRSEFVKILGPLDQILKEEAARREAEAREKSVVGRMRSLSRGISQTFTRKTAIKKVDDSEGPGFNMDELQTVRVLGTGRFGTVKLVQHCITNMAYALKVQQKQILDDLNLQKSTFTERDILRSLDNPYFPALYATFQDADCLYMLLELIPGGDFWSILYDPDHGTKVSSRTRLGGIEIDAARFYTANALSAISHLHENDIIYRDLRPENLVMDRTGYLKLVDFGSSKNLVPPDFTNTICGTPEYIPPEMVTARGHNRAVDFWALGVFLFEMLTGCTPFEHADTSGVYRKILRCSETLETAFSSQFDASAKSLITQLLNEVPGLRIGMLRNGVDDVWTHSFLSGISPDQMAERFTRPPVRPDVDNLFEPTKLDADPSVTDILSYTGKADFSDF
mmetsp:Transcript_10782/g.16396  ORF Transcript_10782/g.16396 Transcript_10782/m.16396 type:complete len:1178 (-) Transcript_10782:165-3698(-)|eukprot:CAMPEP_0185038468 /NCGR_PEP_ID=MMETSP1103-20130426/34177_1 /TAXON_ID=36769 /ORGANISM="Paraphysomonas bandaiensis, Strain Caron Lab Isolate" /LENGTH=1177 /DNA_ID=CAMNT_0027576909 /DNA_START=94 /DNA_END=3627 /DNA_ORIENTATION=+